MDFDSQTVDNKSIPKECLVSKDKSPAKMEMNNDFHHEFHHESSSNSERKLFARKRINSATLETRNPITGFGIDNDGIFKHQNKKEQKRSTGNPVTGEGYNNQMNPKKVEHFGITCANRFKSGNSL